MNNSPDFKYIDTHVHLYDEAFDIDFDETLARIRQSGVGCCIFPAIDKESWQRQSECAEKCRGFAFEAIGLHPTSVVLRAKGIVAGQDGQWIHFDYVPGEENVRHGAASTMGRLCVIGSKIDTSAMKALFGVE